MKFKDLFFSSDGWFILSILIYLPLAFINTFALEFFPEIVNFFLMVGIFFLPLMLPSLAKIFNMRAWWGND